MRNLLYLTPIKLVMYSEAIQYTLTQFYLYFIQLQLCLSLIFLYFFNQSPLINSWNRRILCHSCPCRCYINRMKVDTLFLFNRNGLIFILKVPMKAKVFWSCCILVVIWILIGIIHFIFTSCREWIPLGFVEANRFIEIFIK